MSFFLFIIFVVYTMLPFNMRDAIIASVLTASSHTVVLSICLSATPGAKEHLVWQVGDQCPPPPPLGARGAEHLFGVRLGYPAGARGGCVLLVGSQPHPTSSSGIST